MAGRRPRPPLAPGDHRIELPFGGRRRGYLVHVPPAGGRTPAGLLVLSRVPGRHPQRRAQQRLCHIDPLADRAGFLVVYPDGTGRLVPFLTWNGGT